MTRPSIPKKSSEIKIKLTKNRLKSHGVMNESINLLKG